MSALHFSLDGASIPFTEGQTILQAAMDAGHYVPHLCFHPDLKPHGSCKVCSVRVDGHMMASCTTPARQGMKVESNTTEVDEQRRAVVQMLFVEGNHFCPSCEQSGRCKLQATAYELQLASPHYDHFYPDRALDASHPDFLLDFNRCILCSLCVRASRDVDQKAVFGLAGRGIGTRLIVNSESGRLGDSDFTATDMAAQVCPVGAILPKRRGFDVPIGKRTYDLNLISETDRGGPDER